MVDETTHIRVNVSDIALARRVMPKMGVKSMREFFSRVVREKAFLLLVMGD